MLISILGNLGSGKTLLASYFALKIKDKKILSNFKLNIDNYQELKAIDLLNLPNDVEVILDEAYTWLESRISANQLNRYLSYIMLQSRKRSIDIILTAQLFSSIDKRFRQMSDVIITCERISAGFKYDIINKNNFKTKTYILDNDKAKKIFKIYDTKEIIEPFDKSRLEFNLIKTDTDLIMKISNKIAKEIRPKLNRITHNNVKLALMREGHDKNFEPWIYAILKRDLNE